MKKNIFLINLANNHTASDCYLSNFFNENDGISFFVLFFLCCVLAGAYGRGGKAWSLEYNHSTHPFLFLFCICNFYILLIHLLGKDQLHIIIYMEFHTNHLPVNRKRLMSNKSLFNKFFPQSKTFLFFYS